MYVGGELQLSQEFHTYWNQLSDTVFTSSDSTLYSSGKLYSINGIELTQDNQVFRRVGDHIYSEDYVYDFDGPLPKQGTAVSLDKRSYRVADAIAEDGIYSITLEANRG